MKEWRSDPSFLLFPIQCRQTAQSSYTLIPSLCAFVLSAKGVIMRYEVRYMVNGCGKKIPSTRTIVVYDGDKVVAEVRTREEIDIFRRKYEEKSDPPQDGS